MAIRVLGIDHLVLRTADLARLVDFYSNVLGCTVERRRDELGLVHLRAGRSMIDLVDVAGPLGKTGGAPPGSDAKNLDHFALRIETFDADAIRAQLTAAGVPPGPVMDNFGAEGNGPSIYLRDPDGNTIELQGPARELHENAHVSPRTWRPVDAAGPRTTTHASKQTARVRTVVALRPWTTAQRIARTPEARLSTEPTGPTTRRSFLGIRIREASSATRCWCLAHQGARGDDELA